MRVSYIQWNSCRCSLMHHAQGRHTPSQNRNWELCLRRCLGSGKMEYRNRWPSAKRRASETVYHGHMLVDHYSWMKAGITQDTRNYINQETRLTEILIRETQPFQTQILKRLEELELENETEMPTVIDGTIYFRISHSDSWHYYRRRRSSVNNNGSTELILDTAVLTEMYGHPVILSAVEISSDQEHMAFVVETSARDTYDAHIIQTGSDGAVFVDRLSNVLSVEFAQHGVLYYTKMIGLRAGQVWRHYIGQDVSQDKMILEEPDERYFVDLSHTKDRLYITININSSTTSEVYLLDSCNLAPWSPTLVCPRQAGMQYFVEHSRGTLYILINASDDGEYRIVTSPVPVEGSIKTLGGCVTIFKPEEKSHILDMDVFTDHIVLCMMKDNVPRVIVLPVDTGRQPSIVQIPDHFCKIVPGPNATCTARDFQFSLSSPVHPTTNFCLEVGNERHPEVVLSQNQDDDEKIAVKAKQRMEGNLCRRLEAVSQDGTHVPITVFHRGDVRLTGSNPMLVRGYGAYGLALDMSYDYHTALLVELGWVVAYCHVRGGSDLGVQWHHSGRALNKIKSFEDFQACITTLHQHNYSQPALTALHGISAGGLLVAAVCNRAPHLVQAAVLEVPYVDILSTMLDPNLNLQETEEWGDPINDPEAFEYIKSYCPYQKITNQEYPTMLVTTSLADTRVPVWIPLKYVAKLRHMASLHHTRNSLYLWVQDNSSHFGQWGELGTSEQVAIQTAFLYRTLGLNMD